jgi:glycosyltransferase involved in cell wall biosynthesis
MPVVSIITACLNSEKHLEETIASVVRQTYPHIEYILVDGGSTDGTPEIIKKYGDRIAVSICEPDNGVYDAMNKGIRHSTGDVIYFLNAGDSLYDAATIEAIAARFRDEDVFAVYGNVEVINDCKQEREIRGCRVTFKNLLYRRICHQALFARRFLFEEMGLFSLEFKLSADHDFIVRCIKKYPEHFFYEDSIIALYRDGGMSCKGMERTKMEDLKIIFRNYTIPQAVFGAAICGYVVLKYKIPQLLHIRSANFE